LKPPIDQLKQESKGEAAKDKRMGGTLFLTKIKPPNSIICEAMLILVGEIVGEIDLVDVFMVHQFQSLQGNYTM